MKFLAASKAITIGGTLAFRCGRGLRLPLLAEECQVIAAVRGHGFRLARAAASIRLNTSAWGVPIPRNAAMTGSTSIVPLR
jgi:hypothetical protein